MYPDIIWRLPTRSVSGSGQKKTVLGILRFQESVCCFTIIITHFQLALDRTKSEQLHYTWQYFQEVSFTDGNADVFIYVNRERKYYILVDVAAALCGVLVWIGVFAFGVSGYVRYIRQLSGEVAKPKMDYGRWILL